MSENQFTKMLQDQLNTKLKKVAEVTEKRMALMDEEQSLNGDIDALKQLLKSEKGGKVSPGDKQHQEPQSPPPLPDTNVAKLIRDMIEKNSSTGITMNEIRIALKKAGVFISPSYPYSVIHRLKRTKAIKENRNRYFPVVPDFLK